MGSDAVQSEDAMREMWGDSIKAVKCQHARITYGDFLLLMKGQTKEELKPKITPKEGAVPSILGTTATLDSSNSSLVGPGFNTMLHVVPEGNIDESEHEEVSPPSGDDAVVKGAFIDDSNLLEKMNINDSGHTPVRISSTRSAPSTPADHKKMVDLEDIDSPLSMDDDDDITSSGPGVPGSAASLTPPVSPQRGFQDYVTPLSGPGRCGSLEFKVDRLEGLMLPGLAKAVKPPPYSRRRSRSVDDQDTESSDPKDMLLVADAVRDMLLPETDHDHAKKNLDAAGKDAKETSALVVNRKLYRAHRQMRMAVLEASKRFEEQQAAHAKEVIIAQRVEQEEAEDKTDTGMGMIQAGLVMRHGHTKQVSSEAIRNVLRENRVQQQALVEKATRRGGRGRRSRKKTISDMSAMMNSMGQDELGSIAISAAMDPPVLEESKTLSSRHIHAAAASIDIIPEIPEDIPGDIRGATVPGNFRKTTDPFSHEGLYGTVNGNGNGNSWK